MPPIFKFSLTRAIIKTLVAFFITVLVGVYLFWTQPLGLAGLVWFSFLSLIPFGGAVRYLLEPIRTAEFYEDHFKVGGRREGRDLRYSDINRVSKVNVFPALTPPTQVHIRVVGTDKPLVLVTNPFDRKLKLDLYSWLSRKTQQSAVNQKLSYPEQ